MKASATRAKRPHKHIEQKQEKPKYESVYAAAAEVAAAIQPGLNTFGAVRALQYLLEVAAKA